MWLSSRDAFGIWEKVVESQPSLSPPPVGAYGRVARRKPLSVQDTWKPAWSLLKNTWRILWSDETKIEHFGLILSGMCGENQALLITCPIQSQQWSMVVAASAVGVFSAAGTGRLVAIEGKMNAAKYRDILDENLLQSAQDLRLAEGLPSNKTMTLSTQLK